MSLLPLARWLAALAGWRRNATLFALGVCATGAMAPFFMFWLLVLSFSGLAFLIFTAPRARRAFADGWWWGWGFFMSGLYWLCFALLVEAERFAWLIPFALFGLTGLLAFYPALACAVARRAGVQGAVGKVAVFAAAWTGVEALRACLFTGFPWNLAGHGFGFSDALLQLASVTGIYGMSWLAALVAAMPAALLLTRRGGTDRGRAWRACAAAYLVLAASWGWGAWRLAQADDMSGHERFVPGVRLRLVQAAVEQSRKWAYPLEGVEAYMSLTLSEGFDSATHVIWPESAVPYSLNRESALARILARASPPGGVLITGTMRSDGEGERWKAWNSIASIDHTGAFRMFYDKERLVPFGEYIPLRGWIPLQKKITHGSVDFSRGPGPMTVDLPGLPPVSPLVCYEVIFPGIAVSRSARPAWMLNVTNDAWFGVSTGPHQHFHMARMRAVEQGIPLVRSANNGISAIIDAYGRVIKKLDLNQKGILDGALPSAAKTQTIYSRITDDLILLLIFITTFFCIILKKYKFY